MVYENININVSGLINDTLNTHIKIMDVSETMLNGIQVALFFISLFMSLILLFFIFKTKFTLKTTFYFIMALMIIIQNLYIDLYFLIAYENRLFLINLFCLSLCFSVLFGDYFRNLNRELNLLEKIKALKG